MNFLKEDVVRIGMTIKIKLVNTKNVNKSNPFPKKYYVGHEKCFKIKSRNCGVKFQNSFKFQLRVILHFFHQFTT